MQEHWAQHGINVDDIHPLLHSAAQQPGEGAADSLPASVVASELAPRYCRYSAKAARKGAPSSGWLGRSALYESLHEEGMFAVLTCLHACSWRLRYLLGCTGEDGLDILSILLQVIDRARAAKAEGRDREAWKVLHDVGAWAASGKHGYTSLS